MNFLTPLQTYFLFGNIIDNAVEVVKPLPSQEPLTCREEGALVIEESSYFNSSIKLNNGQPTPESRSGPATVLVQKAFGALWGSMPGSWTSRLRTICFSAPFGFPPCRAAGGFDILSTTPELPARMFPAPLSVVKRRLQ